MEKFNRYFMDTIKNSYAKFDGRASRSQFWYFALFYFIANLILALVDTFLINPMLGATPDQVGQGGFLQIIFALALLVPSIAIAIRRLHDIGKSGWWYLIAFIPVIGILVLLYFFVQDSQPEANQYGYNPKSIL
ncbi:Integral membrane protein [hydrothermal vent metagenome]|uniref:Integral membrane protein n=1 Tax=hydrothermal vent metagenome TaxID=652676 RepID=A0A1W1EEX6_9ZZZZ